MEEFESMPMDDGGIFALFGLGTFFFFLVIYAFVGFCYGKLFEKAGRPLWTGFVPIYNFMVMLEIVGRPTWWIILYLIPFVNFIIVILVSIDLAKSYGKDTLWGILLVVFSIVMLPLMAFSSDIKYVGPAAANETGGSGM